MKRIKGIDENEADLTLKERKFLKYYLESGNISRSAIRAGWKWRGDGFAALAKPHVRAAFQRLLENNGLTDAYLSEVLLGGMKATRLHNANVVIKKNDEGKMEVQDTNDFIEIDDWATRHKFLETALKLKDKLVLPEENKGKQESPEIYFIQLIQKISKIPEVGIEGGRLVSYSGASSDNLKRFVQD